MSDITKTALANVTVIIAAMLPIYFFLHPVYNDGTTVIAIYGILGIVFTVIFAVVASRLRDYLII
jgi:hypothetical protein